MIRPTIRPSNVDIWSVNNKDSDEPHGDSDLDSDSQVGDSDLDSDSQVGDSDLDSDLPVGDSTTTLVESLVASWLIGGVYDRLQFI